MSSRRVDRLVKPASPVLQILLQTTSSPHLLIACGAWQELRHRSRFGSKSLCVFNYLFWR